MLKAIRSTPTAGAARSSRSVSMLLLLGFALGMTGCDDDERGERDAAPPACVKVGSGDSSLHVAVPNGFRVDDDSVTVDVLLKAAPLSDDEVLPAQVALHHFADADEHDNDEDLLDRALTFAIPYTGRTPERLRASRRIDAERLLEITFKTEAMPSDRLYNVHAQLEKVGDDRFAVVLIAPDAASYDELARQVLPTVAPGSCPH